MGHLDFTSTSGENISNGVLSFGATLIGGPLPTLGSTNYTIQSAGSWITFSGNTVGGPVGFNGTFTSGSLAYTNITVGTTTYYSASVVNSYYDATDVSSYLINLLGLKGTSFTGGLLNLSENNTTTVSGTMTTGTGVTPVPIPPALLLFAPALLGLIGMRKRLKG